MKSVRWCCAKVKCCKAMGLRVLPWAQSLADDTLGKLLGISTWQSYSCQKPIKWNREHARVRSVLPFFFFFLFNKKSCQRLMSYACILDVQSLEHDFSFILPIIVGALHIYLKSAYKPVGYRQFLGGSPIGFIHSTY